MAVFEGNVAWIIAGGIYPHDFDAMDYLWRLNAGLTTSSLTPNCTHVIAASKEEIARLDLKDIAKAFLVKYVSFQWMIQSLIAGKLVKIEKYEIYSFQSPMNISGLKRTRADQLQKTIDSIKVKQSRVIKARNVASIAYEKRLSKLTDAYAKLKALGAFIEEEEYYFSRIDPPPSP